MGEGKLTPLTTPTPLNRQSPNIANVITSTILYPLGDWKPVQFSKDRCNVVEFTGPPHATFGQGRPRGYFSPYSQSYHSLFYFFLRTQNSFYRPRAQAVEPILTCDTSADAYSRRVVLLGVRRQYFHIFTLKTHKTPFLGTYNGKPIQNTYSHNYMIHRDTMLKFGTLFGLTKYFEHTQYIFSIRSTAGG